LIFTLMVRLLLPSRAARAVPLGGGADRRCLPVAGRLDFGMVSLLASLVGPLAAARISVFVASMFDTVHVRVKERDCAQSCKVIRKRGHVVAAPLP
jgi:uncharacterized protein